MLKAFRTRNYFDLVELSITLLIALFLLIDQKVIVYLITLLGLNVVIGGIVRGFKKPNLIFYPFALLFLFYLIGLLFTDNFDYGGSDVETRLSFILLPLFYSVTKREKTIPLSWVIWSFVIGALIYQGICLYLAFDCMEIERSRFCFESSKLAQGMHPTYAAIYLIAGSAFVLFDAFSKPSGILKKIAAILVILIFYYFVYKLYSLGPWIGFAGMFTTVLFAVFYFRKRLVLFFVGIVSMGVLGFFLIQNLDLLRSDYNAVTNELSTYFEDKEAYVIANQNNPGSINARIILWNTSFSFIKEHPFGVGTGDVKDELMTYYRANGMDAYADRKLNPHCQYLQTAASIGIFSALFLIATMFYYLWLGFKHKNYHLIALISLFATASLFESILERQWGIIFFLFFLCVFLTQIDATKSTDSAESISD